MAENISIKQEKEKETKEKRLKPEEEKEESTPRKNVPAKITIPQARFVVSFHYNEVEHVSRDL